MRISRIVLYKTPLDPNYNNVYDEYSTEQEYYNFLNSNFPHIFYNPPKIRSVKSNSSSLNIIVQGLQDELRDFNYAQVQYSGGNAFYYFITNSNSVNDSNNGATTELQLVFDSWSNNYLTDIKKCVINVSRSHLDTTLMGQSQTTNNKLFKSSNIAVYDKNVTAHSINENSLSSALRIVDDERLKNCVILWKMIRFDGEKINREVGDSSLDPMGSIVSQSITPIYYEPLAIIDIETRRPIVIKETSATGAYDVLKVVNGDKSINYDIANGIIYSKTRTDAMKNFTILDVQLTFVPLIFYRLDTDGAYIVIDITNGQYNTSKIVDLYTLTEGDVEKVISVIKIDDQIVNAFEQEIWTPYETESIALLLAKENFKKSIDYDFNVSKEGVMLQYPFLYRSIKSGNNSVNIIPPYGINKARIIAQIGETTTPRFSLSYSDNGYTDLNINATKMSALFSNDSFVTFWRNNGEQVSANRFSKIVNSLGTALKGAVGLSFEPTNTIAQIYGVNSIVDTATNIVNANINYASIRKDADNALDAYSNISMNGLDDLNYQDDIVYKLNTNIDENVKRNAYYDVHYYGVFNDCIRNIDKNYRYSYDYVRGNLNVKHIKNQQDRIALKNAFNHGVTKWHLTGLDSDAIVDMKLDVINLEKNIVKDLGG